MHSTTRFSFTLCLLFISTAALLGQERFLKRALEDIDKSDWTSAESNIQAYETKAGEKPESFFVRYCLLKKAAKTVSEFHKAKVLLSKASAGFAVMTSKLQQEWCKDIEFCATNITNQEIEIDSLLFDQVRRTNSMKDVNWYLDTYPTGTSAPAARQWKIHLLFLEAVTTNTEESYKQFLAAHPNHHDAPDATKRLWGVAWQTALQSNTSSGYEAFINKYPTANQADQARQKIAAIAWENAERLGTEAAYLAYAKEYPNSTNAGVAQKKAEELSWSNAQKARTKQALLDFAKKYPNSDRKEEAFKTAEALAWQEAKQSVDSRLLKQFILEFPTSDNIAIAQRLIEENAVDVLPWLLANRKYRLYNVTDRQFVTEIEYDFIAPAMPNRFVVCRDQKKGLIDKKGNVILPSNYEEITQIAPGIFCVQLNSKKGLMNKDAEILVPFQYSQINRTKAGSFIVGKTQDDKTILGLLDPAGKTIIPPKYQQLEHLFDSLYTAGSTQGLGLINDKGATLVSARFEIIQRGVGNQLLVREKNKWGVIRPNGTYVMKPQFQYYSSSHGEESLAEWESAETRYYIGTLANNRYVLHDTAGITLMASSKDITDLGMGFYKIEAESSSTGETATKKIYSANRRSFISNRRFEDVGDFGENKFWVSELGRSGYIDTTGQAATPFIFSDESYIQNPLLEEAGCDGGSDFYEEVDESEASTCSLYGTEWEEQTTYELPWSRSSNVFFNGFAAVNIEGKIGYIDSKGTIRIQPQFDQASPFYKGVAAVVKTIKNLSGEEIWKHQLIDTNGMVLADEASISSFDRINNLVLVNNTSWGLDSRFETIALATKQRSRIANGLNYINFKNGYFLGTLKDAEVYVSSDGNLLMDRNVNFNRYDAEALVSDGLSLIYSDKIDAGIQKYKEALELRPRFIRAMMSLVDAYKQKENHSEVMFWYNKAITTSPSDLSLLTSRKDYLYEKRQWSDVLRDLEILSQRESDVSNHWFQKGYAESVLGYHDRAIASYTRMLELDKNNIVGLNNRGGSYLAKGMLAQALNDYSMGIRYASADDKANLGQLYNNRGITLVRLNRKAEACQDFQKANNLGYSGAAQNVRYHCLSR